MKPSRRQFLETVLAAPLAGALTPSGARLLQALPLGPGQEQFDNPFIIRYDAHCFVLDGQDAFVFSAAFHYPRCPRELWRDRLLKFRQAGFNTIETYVFWNYHEPEEGNGDLSEFEDFIKLVKEMGFWMIARPGPYVCAEWDVGGFPHWVVAKRFPLRSNHPESLKTSQHWFSQVMPVIQRHQITVGGPIIMVQVENEYDYSPPMPDADKRAYIDALARMAWNAGINVPLITCWTKQARENSYPDMARIMDTCNFYPRWNIVKQLPPALEKLRKEEPATPLGITELQGGWFSQFGGKLSVEQEGVSGAQYNMLTKTAIEQGVTYFSTYMGFGGTNFDWAAKSLTTTYDYAAPIREPGGLWEKYAAARGVGTALGLFGSVLTRAEAVPNVAQSTDPNVSVTERVSGKSGVVFVRENANADQHFKLSFQDPASPTKRTIRAPREGELELAAREMKMLPVQIPIAGSVLHYTTAEVLATGLIVDRHYLLVYDQPGRVAEFGLATRDEPKVEGDYAYNYWDPEYESVVIGVRVEPDPKVLLVNNHLLVVVIARDQALRTWTPEFSSHAVPGSEEPKPMTVPLVTDAYLLAGSGSGKKSIWAEIDFLPGEHSLTALLPPQPIKCSVDGELVDFYYERQWRTARLSLTTPPLPCGPISLNEVRNWVERFSGQLGGEWLNTRLRPLEDLGPIPYGYVKYLASQFTYSGQAKMFISSFADDHKKVFLNGKLVPEASNSSKQVEFELSRYAQNGSNALLIAYELFGSPNGGKDLGELKGIESVRLGSEAETATALESWQVQRFPAALRGREVDPEFSIGGWSSAQLTGGGAAEDLLPAFTWCRAEFTLPRPEAAWSVAWKVTFEADRDALLHLNGKFVGRYVTAGPQKDFFLPEPYLNLQGKRQNTLTIVLAYAEQANHIRTLRISPYAEYAARRTRLEFEW
jgi:hypothetical protein